MSRPAADFVKRVLSMLVLACRASCRRVALVLAVTCPLLAAPLVAQPQPADGAVDPAARGYLAGNGLLNRGLFELAADEYAQFLADHADHAKAPLARYGLAVCQFRLKKFDAARQELARLAPPPAGFPYAVEVAVMTGQCLAELQRPEEAVAVLETVVRDSPTHELADDAAALLVRALVASGKSAEATRRADEFAQRFPRSDLLAGLRASRRAAELDAAHAAFAAGEFDAALAAFDRLAATTDDPPAGRDANHDAASSIAAEASYWAAKCRLRTGDAADAAARLQRALERFPDSALVPEMRYDRGVALLRADKPDESVAALADFCARHPKHELAPEALHLLATVEHQRGAFDASQAWCAKLLSQFPDHERAARVAWLAADNALRLGRTDEAVKRYERFEQTYRSDPLASSASLRAGLALYRAGKYDEARQKLAAIVARAAPDPHTRHAWLALGDIAFQRGEWEAAEALLRAFVDAAPAAASAPSAEPAGDDDALLKRALALLRLERPSDAVACLDALLERFPRSPHALQARFERGQALLAMNKLDDARAEFDRVLADGGADSRFAPYANQHLAAIALAQRDFPAAAERYRLVADAPADAAVAADAWLRRGEALLAAEQFADAESALRECLRLAGKTGKTPQARARLVVAVARQDRCADALKEVAALERDGLARLDPTLRRAVRQEQAWCLRKLDKPAEAAEVYRRLLRDAGNAGDPAVALELAELEAAAGRHAEAAQWLRPLLAGAAADDLPRELRDAALYRLGVCEFALGRYADAAAALDKLLLTSADGPFAASAGYFCGEAHFQLGAHDKAAERFRRVVESLPADPACGPSLLRLGEALAALQHWPRSEKAFADYLDRFPSTEQWPQARFGVGWARENQQRYDEAIEAYRDVTARHKGPTAARAQFQIGECLFARQRYDDAVRELLKVDILYAYPEWSAAALYEAGRCFEALNKPVEARTQYAAVVANHAKTRWAELAAQRLSQLAGAGLPGK